MNISLRLFGREVLGFEVDWNEADDAHAFDGGHSTEAYLERDTAPLDPTPGEPWEEDRKRRDMRAQLGFSAR